MRCAAPRLRGFRYVCGQAYFIGVQIEVEDAEVLPFPTTRQTLQEMLLDEEEKDFWDDAELAPSQERATTAEPKEGSGCVGTVHVSRFISRQYP